MKDKAFIIGLLFSISVWLFVLIWLISEFNKTNHFFDAPTNEQIKQNCENYRGNEIMHIPTYCFSYYESTQTK